MLDKTFTPQDLEEKLYQKWEDAGVFACQPASKKPPYTIIMPPPNVTGSLHVGHALTYTLQDMLVRFKRQCGFDTLWQPGTDHAGIATQMIVERQLMEKDIKRQDLGRDAFIDKIWEWKEESGSMIVHQQKRLGISPDWDRQCFTMDEGPSDAVKKVFVELYRQGLIYRDKRLVNWDSKFQTAVSDLEVISKESKGHLWHITYKGVDCDDIIVATTRPETLFGDTAVAVHPEDERYKHLIGKHVHLPLTGRIIPVIADDYCDPEKGSGAVKITPAHDFNDFEVGKRHQLPMINILDVHAHLNEEVPEPYRGLSCQAARKLALEHLEEAALLVKIEAITNMVPMGEKSHVEIQPRLTDQWFVDAKTLAQPALKAVEDGTTKFVPEFWQSTYFEWLRNIQPWCISRQIWWGHQIPAWFGPDEHIFVAHDEEEAKSQAQAHYGKAVELRRETDVLDTWFSSALWPFSTLGWPNETPELKKYYPTDVLCTGFDIIFFWVARMMMMGLHFMKEVPFKTVYIHGLIRDESGSKMSKTKGNVVNPLEWIDKYGSDALRFTLASLAVPGRDLKLGESRIESSRNFMTKIWNAARFLQMNNCAYDPAFDPKNVKQTVNQWIVHMMSNLASDFSQSMEKYRFDEAASCVYTYVWGTFCDYYLEFLKPLLAEENTEARNTAAWAFTQILRVINPITPYISETLWQEFVGKDFVMEASWPSSDIKFVDAAVEMDWLVTVVNEIRSRRAEFNVPAGAKIPLHLYDDSDVVHQRTQANESILMRLGRLSEIQLAKGTPASLKGAVQFVLGPTTFVLPLADSIDINAEKIRLEKELEKLAQDIVGANKKLENPDFMTRAKPEIIEEMQERVANATLTQDKIKDALSRLV